jgi:hypothetical protein
MYLVLVLINGRCSSQLFSHTSKDAKIERAARAVTGRLCSAIFVFLSRDRCLRVVV